jgi:hypothetical protein
MASLRAWRWTLPLEKLAWRVGVYGAPRMYAVEVEVGGLAW